MTLTMYPLLIWSLGDHAPLTELLRHTLAAFPDMSTAARMRLLAAAGLSTVLTHGYHEGRAMIEEALRLVPAGHELAHAEVLGARGSLHLFYCEFPAAAEDYTVAYQTLSRAGKRWDALRFGAQLAQVLFYWGKVDEALALANDVIHGARELGHVAARSTIEYVLAQASWLRSGDVGALEQIAQEATRTWPAAGPLFTVLAKGFVALALLEGGVHLDPADVLEGATEQAGYESWRDQFWGEQFRILAYTRPERARAVLARYEHRLPVAGQRAFGGAWAALSRVVDGLATLGELAAAAAFYPQCAEAAVLGLVHTNGHPFECAAGIAAACCENWDVAEAHFARAARETAEMRFVVSEIDVRRWHAWMLLARRAPGDVGRARAMLEHALADARGLGMPWRVRLSESLLRESELAV